MFPFVTQFARAQDKQELQRQFDVAIEKEVERRILALIAFLMAAMFLPLAVCAALAVVDTLAEMLGMYLLRRQDPARHPGRYIAMMCCFLAAQISYCIIPALIWQMENPFAKAYAVGATMVTLIQLSTVRAVHLPLGVIGSVTVTVSALIGNSYYWVALNDPFSLILSNICLLSGAFFAFITILSVHSLHTRMLQGETAARAADTAKSRFLAQMSHELRTPLNAIMGLGSAELALAQHPDSKERLGLMVASARSLGVVLDDILDLSAIEEGKLPVRPTDLHLRDLICSAVSLFRPMILEAGLTLRVDVADDLPEYVRLDGQRLRQCLMNLLSNALKHTTAGAITLQVSRSRAGLLALQVTDTGSGISAAMRNVIFQPFERAPGQVNGTGLGLTISRAFARRMGGDLVLLPDGPGARFLLTVGFTPAQPPPTSPHATIAVIEGLTGKRVLVVDDIATNRLVAATYLRMFGATAIEADGAASALRQVADQLPDLVLLDMHMPGLDGLQTMQHIRALSAPASRLPIVAMTADHDTALPAAGFDGYLFKPITPEAMSHLLRRVLLTETRPT